MSHRTSRFFIGLFVIIGVTIGVVAIVWLGVSNYFAEGDRYVTYFDESVQGLSADSAVKYRGVTVGRVERIGIAPDNRLIEVVMKIDLDDELQQTTVAQLKPVGITGMVFVELNQRDNHDVPWEPEYAFSVPYPVIPSRPSGISEVFSRVYALSDRFMEIDFKGLADELQLTIMASRDLLNNPNITALIENLDATTVRLERTIGGIERIFQEEHPERVLEELAETLSEGRRLIGAAERAISEADLPLVSKEALSRLDHLEQRTGDLMDNLDRTTRLTAMEIRDVSARLRQTVHAMEEILERLSRNPSALLFSRPPEPDREGEP